LAKAVRNKQGKDQSAGGGKPSDKGGGKSSDKGGAKPSGRSGRPNERKSGKPAKAPAKGRPAARPAARSGREKRSLRKFIHEVRVELGKVNWPDRADLMQSTLVVLVAVLIAAVYVAGLDAVFSEVVDQILDLIS
jgi:preprotein translocase subunit SecE